MSLTIRRVIEPSDVELDQYAKLAAEAFDYNYFGSGFGGDKSLQEPFLRAHMLGALVDGAGEVHVAELVNVGVVGVAVWFVPGHMFLESQAQYNAGWNQVMTKLPSRYQNWWITFMKEYEAMSERALGTGVKLGGYHLQLLGVAPAHQQKGIATALMSYTEGKARSARVPCVLETGGTKNITIYKALGYKVAGSGYITAPPGKSNPIELVALIKHTEDEGSRSSLF